MSKILVTGGAGFVGSNLCAELIKNSDNIVWSIDNYSTGTRNNHVEGVWYVHSDTKDIDQLTSYRPDTIYHLGEYSRVEQSFDDIATVWKSNKDGTFAVLEFARKINAKLIYAGSSTKFSDDELGPNQSPYAWTKSSNTQLVMNYGDWFGLDYAITYFYNVYGKREIATGHYATLIASFLEKHRNKLPLTVVAPGTQERNFTHIDDIVSGLILVGNRGHGDGYGIGNQEKLTVMEIAKMFGDPIDMLPPRAGNRMSAGLHIEKTMGLGWKPTKSIKHYIEEELNKQ